MLLFIQKMENETALSWQMKGFQQDECYYLNRGLVQKIETEFSNKFIDEQYNYWS